MKASEIVDKFKSILLSSDDQPQTELKVEDEEVKDGVKPEDMPKEAPVEEKEEEMKYATKEELEAAVAEMRAMYDTMMKKIGSDEMETEVPTEELAKEELSAQEPAGEPITHSPEVGSAVKPQFFSGIKPRNTMSVVYEKMFNK